MAATPPLQIIGSPQTPPTPLHRATYDQDESPRRTSARLRQKRALHDNTSQTTTRNTRSAKTPSSPRTSYLELRSPDQTPQRKSTSRRVEIISPTSPESDTFALPSNKSRMANQPQYLSTNTTMGEGMLPTPVKTPSKKQKMINKSNIAARALFQDQLPAEEIAPSPRRNRKTKRYNGFSLESFRADNGQGSNGVQIFTDSRDQIPEIDKNEENPFLDLDRRGTSKQVAGTSKRRKVSESKKLDPQVEDALRDDEGMVYVFRGKKVYRRFDDGGEEEEEIDADDIGLLRHTQNRGQIVKPLKTMIRKSIKPTRLFQTEAQKRAREIEKEEEASTDIDDSIVDPLNNDLKDQSYQNQTGKTIGNGKAFKGKAKLTQKIPPSPLVHNESGGKKSSFFDSWPRVKPGSASSSSSTPRLGRGRKRAASESIEEPISASG